MAEILSEELYKEGVNAPFFELPDKATPDSKKRKKFWKELIQEVEPFKKEFENK